MAVVEREHNKLYSFPFKFDKGDRRMGLLMSLWGLIGLVDTICIFKAYKKKLGFTLRWL